PLGAGNEERIEIRLLRVGVAPHRLVLPISSPRLVRVMPLRIDGKVYLIHGRIIAGRPLAAVVEDEHVSFTGKTPGNPMGVVLGEKLLVLFLPRAIGARIAPAVEEVA